MDDDYIGRQVAIDAANDWLLDCFKVQKMDRSCGLIRRLEDAPSADVTVVKRGKWILGANHGLGVRTLTCDQCGEVEVKSRMPNFCSNCGAKMDGTIEGYENE